jgi:hypothetical protein
MRPRLTSLAAFCLPFAVLVGATLADESAPPVREPFVQTLFDFEDSSDAAAWSNLALPEPAAKEPAAKIELSDENATSGKHSLKITFAGGHWPTITTTQVPGDWLKFWTFKADITVSRPCVVGFSVLQEKSKRDGSWEGVVSRWAKTEQLHAGTTTVTGTLHDPNDYSINAKNGPVVRFEIFMYEPHAGESIYVDNIRISTAKETAPAAKTQFQVLGTDLVVSGVRELAEKLRDRWQPPTPKDVDTLKADFRSRYAELKQSHPHAVLAIFRDGERGYDPAHPDAVYDGWKDAYWSSHGPDPMTVERAHNIGKSGGHEIFMRHRSPLMRVDLSSIPAGAKILAAELVIVNGQNEPSKDHSASKPNMWVAEACNRDWQEEEVNAYQYAKDKFWQAIGGMYWGEDPDFLPLYLAYGPSQGKVNRWDFTEAVRFWTDGHPNHGFMLHGNGGDWLGRAHSREAENIKDRPALLVIYDPK